MSGRPPPLLVEDDTDESSSSESEVSECENEWPAGLRAVVGARPSKKDYDQVCALICLYFNFINLYLPIFYLILFQTSFNAGYLSISSPCPGILVP